MDKGEQSKFDEFISGVYKQILKERLLIEDRLNGHDWKPEDKRAFARAVLDVNLKEAERQAEEYKKLMVKKTKSEDYDDGRLGYYIKDVERCKQMIEEGNFKIDIQPTGLIEVIFDYGPSEGRRFCVHPDLEEEIYQAAVKPGTPEENNFALNVFSASAQQKGFEEKRRKRTER